MELSVFGIELIVAKQRIALKVNPQKNEFVNCGITNGESILLA